MIAPRAACLALALSGCTLDPPPSARRAPSWRGAAVLDARGERRILARGVAALPEATDRPVARDLALSDGRTLTPPPSPSVSGRLTATGALWVTTSETLVDSRGRVLARSVQGALAVRDDGGEVAYVVGDEGGYSAWVAGPSGEGARRVSDGLASVEALRYWGEHRLVAVGARSGGVLGVWVLDTRPGVAPQPVTNAHLRAGSGEREGFVPPPADPASMRIHGETLTYFDGEGARSVALPRGNP